MQGKNIDMSKFVTKVYYSPAGATISELKPYDKEKNIYYVEISFPQSGICKNLCAVLYLLL